LVRGLGIQICAKLGIGSLAGLRSAEKLQRVGQTVIILLGEDIYDSLGGKYVSLSFRILWRDSTTLKSLDMQQGLIQSGSTTSYLIFPSLASKVRDKASLEESP
jgi:hypothetical protein